LALYPTVKNAILYPTVKNAMFSIWIYSVYTFNPRLLSNFVLLHFLLREKAEDVLVIVAGFSSLFIHSEP